MHYFFSFIIALMAGVGSYLLAIRKSKDDDRMLVEKYKLEKINYISKTKFDVEFAVYRELSENIFNLVTYSSLLFPDYMYTSITSR